MSDCSKHWAIHWWIRGFAYGGFALIAGLILAVFLGRPRQQWCMFRNPGDLAGCGKKLHHPGDHRIPNRKATP